MLPCLWREIHEQLTKKLYAKYLAEDSDYVFTCHKVTLDWVGSVICSAFDSAVIWFGFLYLLQYCEGDRTHCPCQ